MKLSLSLKVNLYKDQLPLISKFQIVPFFQLRNSKDSNRVIAQN